MHALFAARGPSFREHTRTETIRTVDVYGILAQALDVAPAPNSGDLDAAARVMRSGS